MKNLYGAEEMNSGQLLYFLFFFFDDDDDDNDFNLAPFQDSDPTLFALIWPLRHALDIREHYERKLERANNLYMELSAIMLQLEVREKELMK